MSDKEKLIALYNELTDLDVKRFKIGMLIDQYSLKLEKANETFRKNENKIFTLKGKIRELLDKKDEGTK